MNFCDRQQISKPWTSDLDDSEVHPAAQELGDVEGAIAAASLVESNDDIPAARPAYRETLLDDVSYLKQTSNRRCNGGANGANAADSQPFGTASGSNATLSEGDKAFASLFAPPAALDNPNSFEKALQAANNDRKILLVNIQKHDSFEAHKLTRDVWRSEAVQGIISAFFSFWQRFSDHPEGEDFCNLYQVASFPHVCAIDPRTGRRLKVWSVKQIIDPTAATSEFMDFAESKATTQIYASLGATLQASSTKKRTSPKRAFSETGDSTYTSAPISVSDHSSSLSPTCSASGLRVPTSEVNVPGNSDPVPSEYVTMNTLLKTLHLERVKRRTPS